MPPDYTAGCPWPPAAHSPPPAARLCQEHTRAASKHPWAPAQGSALATMALPWTLWRHQGRGWRGASRKKKAPTPRWVQGQVEKQQGGAPSRELRSQVTPIFSVSSLFPPLLRGPQRVGSLPAPLSCLCLLVSPTRACCVGGGGGEGTRSRGRGGRRGRRQFNFQSWSCQFRSWHDKKVISVMGF